MDLHELSYRLKSARQKKRLVKKDRDKQLIQLAKRQDLLWKQKKERPMIPLEHPYQRGWKRLYVLRDDVVKSPRAEFYQGILKKINNVRYHHDKSFKVRKRRKCRYYYVEKPQTLREITEREWQANSLKLSDVEKQCFYPKLEWDKNKYRMVATYVFIESWRFVLVVKPHIIYEVKMHDEVIEQELGEISNAIDKKLLGPRIHRLTSGRSYRYWSVKYFDKPKYINKLKNKPLYLIKDECSDKKTSPTWAI